MIPNHVIGNSPNWPTKMPIVSVKEFSAFQIRRNYLGVRGSAFRADPLREENYWLISGLHWINTLLQTRLQELDFLDFMKALSTFM
jgi:hypothetical protein